MPLLDRTWSVGLRLAGARAAGDAEESGGIFLGLQHLRGQAGAGPALGVAVHPHSPGVIPRLWACVLARRQPSTLEADQMQEDTSTQAAGFPPMAGESSLCQEVGSLSQV